MKWYWFFLFLSAFKNHCEFDHMATMQNAPCIWCGATFAQLELLRFHYHKCSQKMALSEANWTLCGFCPTIFFFTELTKSAFFIGHMNNYHRQNVDFSWGSQVSFKRSIFQIFWKEYCCAKFLFFEWETSNFGSLLIF